MKRRFITTLIGLGLLYGSAASAATAEEVVQRARQAVAHATAPVSAWDGPRSGPALAPAKRIIFIASDMKNGGVLGVRQGLAEAATAAGWSLDTLDGAGSVKDQLAALNQAIARRPDGIVIGGWNPNVAKIPLKKARQQGIVLTAWHALPTPGAIPEYDIFYNVTSDSDEVARVAAQYAVAASNGTARVLIFTDSLYQIALDKANAMKAVIEQCQGCRVVEFIDTPLADTANRMPGMTYSLLQKQGDDFEYALAINDLYFDFMAPALQSAGKGSAGQAPFTISAGDGSVSAYQRVRSGRGQVATVPEPLRLHGWQLLDEFNRAFAGEAPSGYVTPAHLVTRDNIESDGGRNNEFDPDNGYRQRYLALWGVR
ncbi:substrate-binding domain-containing protein [Edwardsiella piscicida]|nr:substrate-binding domain-containing protein [Edwardsiella piscicida]ELM3729787.1 substrate-binding domain-containing protein [Edwardsiella piscicida]ELV7537236.1 substrate-binding domain-containing protein [Edwardsiella piscicida]